MNKLPTQSPIEMARVRHRRINNPFTLFIVASFLLKPKAACQEKTSPHWWAQKTRIWRHLVQTADDSQEKRHKIITKKLESLSGGKKKKQ